MRPKVSQLRRLDNPTDDEADVVRLLGPFAPDPGFYFVVDADTEEVLEPALLFLYSRHAHDGRRSDDPEDEPSVATNRASAFELAEWLRFCAHVKRRWDKADHDLICLYAHLLANRASYHTGRARGPSTISHKLSTIYSFYRFANATGLTAVRWDASSVQSSYRRTRRTRDRGDDNIRPFAPKELRDILAALGPPPSERSPKSTRPCRDRLVFETGLLTGMRGEEICHLRVNAILRLPVDLARPDETQPLRIFVTKGRKKRWVALPNSLVHELKLYIRGERKAAVEEMNARRGEKDHGRLFVNQSGHPKAGRAIGTSTIHRRTSDLMRRLGLTKHAQRVVDGVKTSHLLTIHSFHDTRHTYAVNLYISQRKEGDSEPWQTVQRMLGHEHWKTTEQYYLRAVGVFEPLIGMRVNAYWEME